MTELDSSSYKSEDEVMIEQEVLKEDMPNSNDVSFQMQARLLIFDYLYKLKTEPL